ncbi:uncharacterized protein LOC110446033 [Mizuhopecten yessoensis]|uniref:Uncharacterized protein n=1 Tax=Mizuhopecten yessoensis TaxID=6573 RepID=A0A210QY73_MIZYE|nr:uncharacterized protein LOC110446033 [Mizuhopecten yessoensis]OWF53703.1 hypothetical protein KP79_PYT15792 [Mizuhopecten yessoensis]
MAINKCKLVIFIVSILSRTFDLACDWLIYYEVSGLEQGLVFGPFSTGLEISLLVFCGIGSAVYILDVILGLVDLNHEDYLPAWLLDGVNVVSIWFADVPQILINVYIAGCREEAISILQMAKAIATLVEVLTNIGFAFAKSCYIKFKSKKTERNGIFLKVFIGIGLTVMLVGSIMVFGLTHFYLDSDKVVQFYSPQSFYSGKYDSHKYLNRSGINMHFDSGQSTIVTMNPGQWIKLADITDATSGTSQSVVASVKYNSSPNTRIWIQSTTLSDLTAAEKSTCYDTSTTPFTVVTSCSTDLPATAVTTSVVLKFVYQVPSSATPLGDINYNFRVYEGSCVATASNPQFSLGYSNVLSSVDNSLPLEALSVTTGQYYVSVTSLQGISKAWKTGQFGCESTGSTAPKLDTAIIISCVTWT